LVSQTGKELKLDGVMVLKKDKETLHGDKDQTLPYKGGLGNVSSWMDWALGTNLDKSAPYMQSAVWSKADQCDGPVAVHDNAQVTSRDYIGCKVGEVREYILKGGQHGINDYKNDGSRFAQWLLGSADRSQDFASQGADFLKKWIVSDPSMKRPG
jgi:poly(3-hydroxybutyrate) depolymerase